MGNPVYHLRPNKAVDRNLFVEILVRLWKFVNISDYRYIGFGSYEFDDFKLVYRSLGIKDMHSIEMDSDVFKRQIFNKPYSFIRLFNKTCSGYFDENYEGEKPSIVWADFSEANKKYAQCQDIVNICGKINEGDILRITLNANPTSIPTGNRPVYDVPTNERKKLRFDTLRNELGDFFPIGINEGCLTNKEYPRLLLKIIKKAIYHNLDDNLSPCPLCSYVYSDNTQMMTVTIIMCSKKDRDDTIAKLNDIFSDWEDYVNIGDWNKTITIDLPALTVHEQLEIGQYEQNETDIKKIENKTGITSEEIKKYWLFARYYPNFQHMMI